MHASRSERAVPLALVGISLGYFMVLFDTTALAVALPDLARDLGPGLQGLAWITDAYTLTFAGCLLAGGLFADRQGADRAFLAGLAAFGALSLACAVAPTTGLLIVARALLGGAGALIVPASLSLIAGLYPEPPRRAKAIGAWASITGAALTAGPLLGGVLVAALGWRGIFLVNAPVAALSMVVLRGRLPEVPRRVHRIEARCQVAVLIGVTALTWTLIRGGVEGWWSADVLAALVVAVAAFIFAVRAERDSAVPTVPPALLRSPMFAGAVVGGFVVGGALAAELFITTLQLQELRGLGPVRTGLAFLPLTLPMVLNPPVAARVTARVGPARPVLAGLLLIAGATAVLAGVPNDASYAWVAIGLVVLGFGVSFTLPALTSAVVLSAPPDARGAAGGLFSVVRQIGATLGVGGITAMLAGEISHGRRGHALMTAAAVAGAVVWRTACTRSAEPKLAEPVVRPACSNDRAPGGRGRGNVETSG